MPRKTAPVRQRPKKRPAAAKPRISKSQAQRRLPGDLPAEALLARILRVDHAGEFGAQRIYQGQIAVLGKSKLGPVLRHMAAQEDAHLRYFAEQLTERRVRPTLLHPLWHVAGFALGAGTALLGPKAAMACTVAVEEVIDGHYGQQLEQLGEDEPALRAAIARFRAEEVEHRDIGIEHEAESLPHYLLLRGIVRAGSKAAIWLSERF